MIVVINVITANSQELEVFKTDSVTAVRNFVYITGNSNSWLKSAAIIFSRIKNNNSGQEIFGFAIATTSTDSRAREIPEGVAILVKHIDNTVTEIYTESGEYGQKEKSAVIAGGGRYVAFATTISTYSYSYSCEISRVDLKKIKKWGITKMRIDIPGPGWKDFDLASNPIEAKKQLIQLGNMAKQIDDLNMEEVKPDSYHGF